ncbi:relaxase/mobilization nuclease domain-containing protein [Enterococcus sp. DIV0187]|uniref:relaxase/mobilization nuclease domain-containing protein n=1 Tax=Enterococcus sp. DIV0187 TaxID=2774644 RepID=UPI003F2191E9
MVYTKHFFIHTFDHLKNAEDYIKNAGKTTIKENADSDHLGNLFPYLIDENKTLNKKLVSSFGIASIENAADEFTATKLNAAVAKGTDLEIDLKTGKIKSLKLKQLESGNKILGHHVIQSFSPEDHLSPEEIHEIGRKTILELTENEHEFVISTHVDREHIHNHIVFNSTNMITGNSFRWLKGTKAQLEKISDKHASKAGAIIIDKSPRNSHKKYTMWQTEKLFKYKIKSRLDFLLEHSSNIEDFKEKAAALYLHVDFSKKWSTFRLLDQPQTKNTRGRNLSKSDPEKYNLDRIEERVKENTAVFSIDDVIERYEEKENAVKQDFDYQVKIESWQVDHVTSKGIYLNVDFGVANRGQLFIGGYKLDQLDDGGFNLYVKYDDIFYFMNEKNFDRNRYMNGKTLVKQLSLYNGTVPLKKEPVMAELDEIISAINFLADHDVNDGIQLQRLEVKLGKSLQEAQNKLNELDEKIVDLNQLAKDCLMGREDDQTGPDVSKDYESIQKKMDSVKLSRSILHERFDEIVSEIEEYREIRYVAEKSDEKAIDDDPVTKK